MTTEKRIENETIEHSQPLSASVAVRRNALLALALSVCVGVGARAKPLGVESLCFPLSL